MTATVKASLTDQLNGLVGDSEFNPTGGKASAAGGKAKHRARPKGRAVAKRIEDVDLSEDFVKNTWSWIGRIPRRLMLVTAREGTGKSTLVNWLAVQYSTGQPWPDGQPNEAGHVLLFDSEDGYERKLPLLQALGADMSRIGVVGLDELAESGLSLAEFIADYHAQHPDLKFVSIDVCRDFDPRLRTAEDKAMEDALGELKQMALAAKLPIALVHHEAKGSLEKDARDRARGSTLWVTNVRAFLTLATNPAYGPSAFSVETGKSSYGDPATSGPMIFTIESATLPCGAPFGKATFTKFVTREEFISAKSGQPSGSKGRKPTHPPEAITEAILSVLLENGGRMPGRMPSDMKEANPPGSEGWRGYAANLAAEKLGLSAYTVGTHFREVMDDQIIGDWAFTSYKDPGPNGKWLWSAVPKENAPKC